MTTKRPPKKSAAHIALSGLRKTLALLAATPRFPLLRDMPVSRFLGEKESQFSSLQKISLGELWHMSDAEISPLRSLKALQLRSLDAILHPLIGHPPSKEPAGGKNIEKVTPIRTPGRRRDNSLFLGASEAERRLIEVAERLKDSPVFDQLRARKLGEFWDPAWPRAPFEECMNFRQFAELKMDQVLKKHSFGPEKILSVLRAVERGLCAYEEKAEAPLPIAEVRDPHQRAEPPPEAAAAPPSADPPPFIDPPPPSPSIPPKLVTVERLWKKPSRHVPSYCHAMLRFLDSQHALAQTLGLATPCARLIGHLPQALAPDELSLLWLLTEHPMTEVAPLFSMDVQRAAAFAATARTKLRNVLEEICPEVASFWGENAGGSNIPEKLLIDPYIDKHLDRETQQGVLKLTLHAFTAR